jgi:hypothetical protein
VPESFVRKHALKLRVDLSVWASPTDAYGNVAGELKFPAVPAVGDEVQLLSHTVKVQAVLNSEGPVKGPADLLVSLGTLVLSSRTEAKAFGAQLERELGISLWEYKTPRAHQVSIALNERRIYIHRTLEDGTKVLYTSIDIDNEKFIQRGGAELSAALGEAILLDDADGRLLLAPMDHEVTLAVAVRLAHACIEGRLTALHTAREMVTYINPWHPAWEALGGAHGPLAAFFVAQDQADRLHHLGDDVERWHPDVRDQRRKELAEAEAMATPNVLKACRALIDYAVSRRGR